MTPRICLSMIVRNESAIILRCLESAAPWIDGWVIADTGSTDDTMDIIRAWGERHKITGELHQEPPEAFSIYRPNYGLGFVTLGRGC